MVSLVTRGESSHWRSDAAYAPARCLSGKAYGVPCVQLPPSFRVAREVESVPEFVRVSSSACGGASTVRTHGRSYMVCGQPTTATTLWPPSLQETVYVVNTFSAQDVRSLHDGCLGVQRLSPRAAVPPGFVCGRVVVAWVVVFLQAVAMKRLWALYVRTVVRTWYVANATTLLPLLPREIFTW